MRIYVVGSCREAKDPDVRERFKAAGKALGAALAEHGHSIAVGIPNWKYPMKQSLTEYIILGANSVPVRDKKKHTVIFYGPWTPEPEDKTPGVTDTVQEFKQLANIDLIFKPHSGGTLPYGANLIPNLNEVDAVILICGAEGTASIGFAARALGVPLLTVTSLGGSAETMYQDFLGKELVLLQEKEKRLDISALNASWVTETEMKHDREQLAKQAKKAEDIVSLAERMVKTNARGKRAARRALTLSLALSLFFVVSWSAVYVLAAENKIHLTYSFLGLLFLASLIGSCLRTLVVQRDETAILTLRGFTIDLVLSILLAFGLGLFYLIGGISFTGTVVALNKEPNTFQNIAISMSLVGLAAGALIPVQQLMDRLSKVVSQAEPGP
jgi:hypothetical protein